MITRKQAIDVIQYYMIQSQDEDKIDKCKDMLAKLNTLTEIEFIGIVHTALGENADINAFYDLLIKKLQDPELQGTKFVQLNELVSYNLAGFNKGTIALHVVPIHASRSQVKYSASYLVDALEQLKVKIERGEFEQVESIFAVSDILASRALQGYFKALGFEISEGEEMFRRKFKNPYQASLPKQMLLSEEWEKLKEEFMKDRLTVAELEGQEQDGK